MHHVRDGIGDVLLLGGGGHAVDVLSTVDRLGLLASIVGFLDDQEAWRMAAWPISRLGPLSNAQIGDSKVLLGLGFPATRMSVLSGLSGDLVPADPLIDPHGSVSSRAHIAGGVVVLPGARVSSGSSLGTHSFVHHNCTIGHDTIIADHAAIMPGANVSGDCTVGLGSTVGSGAVVLEGCRIGDGAFVGAGAVVISDVLDHTTVVGVPARVLDSAIGQP